MGQRTPTNILLKGVLCHPIHADVHYIDDVIAFFTHNLIQVPQRLVPWL